MSELNSGKIKITNDGNIIMQYSNYHHVIDSDTELYYKHQADKVIAELKAQKAQAEDYCYCERNIISITTLDGQRYSFNTAGWSIIITKK